MSFLSKEAQVMLSADERPWKAYKNMNVFLAVMETYWCLDKNGVSFWREFEAFALERDLSLTADTSIIRFAYFAGFGQIWTGTEWVKPTPPFE